MYNIGWYLKEQYDDMPEMYVVVYGDFDQDGYSLSDSVRFFL
jgi:hypothetical protein